MEKSILIVGDEGSVVGLWRLHLTRKGYQVSMTSWDESLTEARQQSPDLIIVDVSLPVGTCLARCRRLQNASNAPIILLTDQAAEIAPQMGVGLLTRPVRFTNLLRSVENALQSANLPTEAPGPIIQIGDICLDVDHHLVGKGDQQYKLPPKQFQLLYLFMSNPGQVLSRKQLMKEVWNTDYLGDTRTLYVHIRWLRQKIEDNPNAPVYLRTVRDVGYRFNVPE